MKPLLVAMPGQEPTSEDKEGDESAPHFDRSYTETAPLQLRDEESGGGSEEAQAFPGPPQGREYQTFYREDTFFFLSLISPESMYIDAK